jgi:hypothetical protein
MYSLPISVGRIDSGGGKMLGVGETTFRIPPVFSVSATLGIVPLFSEVEKVEGKKFLWV